MTGLNFVRIDKTCDACPAQWDAWTADGTAYYIRFRWGWLSVNHADDILGVPIFASSHGHPHDGWMETPEMLRLIGAVFTPQTKEAHSG